VSGLAAAGGRDVQQPGRRRADHHPQVVIFAMSGKNILPGPVLMMM
jgi:hypothetical protein